MIDQLSLPLDKGSPKVNTSSSPTESWKKRAVDCLLLNQKLMTTIEILRCVTEPKEFALLSLNKDQRLSSVTNLSVTLSNLWKEGYVSKIKITGLKGNYYGLPSWFEKDGRIINKYADKTLRVFLENITRQPHGCCD